MIAVWLTAGIAANNNAAAPVVAFQPGAFQFGAFQTSGTAPPPVVVRRGDDGGLAYGSGTVEKLFRDIALKQFADKLEEIREEVLEAEPEAIAEAVEAVSELRALDIPQDLIARLDAISAALERMQFEADRALVARAVADIEAAQRMAEQKLVRRRREEDMVLRFIARLS